MNDDANIREDQSSEKEIKDIGKKSSKRNKRTEELEQKVKELEDQLKRAVADYRNLEKRLEDEKSDFVKFANRELLARVLPSFDTLFLAEKYVTDDGIKVTIKHLQDALREAGVERIVTSGAVFDPEKMEAVTTDSGEENKVLEELRPGYLLNGKLLRPAQVKVGQPT